MALGERIGFDVDEAFFYSDGYEDVPLLEAVGNPRTLNPDAAAHAPRALSTGRSRASIRRKRARGVEDIVRTGLAYASLSTAGSLAIADFLLNRDIRHARNLAGAVWGELATSALDMRLDVRGEDHLWSHRPAVFVFNHQSQLDAIVMARLSVRTSPASPRRK